MDSKKNTDTELLASILIGVVGIFICGLTVMNLWAWFISSTFGLKPLTFIQAVGLDIFVSFIVTTQPIKNNDDDIVIKALAFKIIYPLLVLFTGWIVQMFM